MSPDKNPPKPIHQLIGPALATLARPTHPTPSDTERARKWLEKIWQYVGNETPNEKRKLEKLFDEAVRWLASLMSDLEPYWLVLIGPSGVGKTLLAQRIAKYLQDYGIYVFNRTTKIRDEKAIFSYAQYGSIFVPWREAVPFSDENRERFENTGKDLWKIIDDLKPQTGEECVIEGEAGVRPKRFEVNAAGDMLDKRLRKWTIITSNLTHAQIALFWDVRIASRLMRNGGTIIETLDVTDFCIRQQDFNQSLEQL